MKPSRFRDKVKKGVSIVTVPVSTLTSTEPTMPELVQKYEPFFQEGEKDANRTKGINVWHVPRNWYGPSPWSSLYEVIQKEAQEQALATQQAFNTVLNQQAQTLNPYDRPTRAGNTAVEVTE